MTKSFGYHQRNQYHHTTLEKIHNELITMRQYLFTVITIILILICIIISVTIWRSFRKIFSGNVINSEVFYTKDDADLCNIIENKKYEIIDFNKP